MNHLKMVEWYWQKRTEELEKILLQCHFTHFESQKNGPGIEPGPSQVKDRWQLPEPQRVMKPDVLWQALLSGVFRNSFLNSWLNMESLRCCWFQTQTKVPSIGHLQQTKRNSTYRSTDTWLCYSNAHCNLVTSRKTKSYRNHGNPMWLNHSVSHREHNFNFKDQLIEVI